MNYTQNEKIEQVTATTLVVGVDIGSQTHYARAFDNRGRERTKRVFSFQNDIEGFNSFQLWTEKLKNENKKTAVLIGCGRLVITGLRLQSMYRIIRKHW